MTQEPQAEDDEIMKVADKLLYEHSLEGSRKALKPVFRLIQAGIQKNKQGIEEVDKRRYMDSKRISDHYQELDTLKTEIEGVRNNLGELTQTVCKHSRQFACLEESQLGRDLVSVECKVEELENETHNLEALLEPKAEGPQPQPKGGVAQASDKDGKMHDLIPGVSVYWYGEGSFEKLFHHSEGEYLYGYAALNSAPKFSNEPWADERGGAIWLRDLSLPGGDK